MTLPVRTGLPDAVQRQLRYPDFFNELGVMRWFGRGDDVAAIISRTGLKAAWTAQGGTVSSSTVITDQVSVSHDTLGFHLCELSTLTPTAERAGDAGMDEYGRRAAGNTDQRQAEIVGAAIALAVTTAAPPDENVEEAARLRSKLAGPAAQALDLEMLHRLIGMLIELGQDGAEPEDPTAMIERGARPLVLKWDGEPARRQWADALVVPFDRLVDRALLTEAQRELLPIDTQFAIGSGSIGCVQFGRLLTKEYVEGDGWYYHLVARLDIGLVLAVGSTITNIELR